MSAESMASTWRPEITDHTQGLTGHDRWLRPGLFCVTVLVHKEVLFLFSFNTHVFFFKTSFSLKREP